MTSNLWNLWEINPPPTCKAKVILHHKEMTNLKELLWDMVKTLKNMSDLDFEAAILSRILYRTKRLFRQDKGMQSMVKIYQCLKKYLKLNFFDIVDNYKKCFPTKFSQEATHAYLPTKQMLLFVLLRLQAFSQIFVRVMTIAKAAYRQTYWKLCLGWANYSIFCVFSIIARFWALSRYLVLKSIEWYNSLYGYLPYFESTIDFLPDYVFPVDLKQWLGDVDLSLPAKKTSVDDALQIINLTFDDEGEVTVIDDKFLKTALKQTEVVIDSDEGEVQVVEEKSQKKEVKNQAMLNPDLGVPVGKKRKGEFGNEAHVSKKQWKSIREGKPFKKHSNK